MGPREARRSSRTSDRARSPRSPYLHASGNSVYFRAEDGTHGSELWVSDGTAAGTVLVKDIKPGAWGSDPFAFVDIGGYVYFSADDGVDGVELWRTDGSAAGTTLVKEINPGSTASAPNGSTISGGAILMPARFLILGSASPDLLRQSSESLAGRITMITMSGFSLEEVGIENQSKHWQRGGFPRSYLGDNDSESFEWRRDFVLTLLERDVPQFGIQIPSTSLFRFWSVLAHYHGQIWNVAETDAL